MDERIGERLPKSVAPETQGQAGSLTGPEQRRDLSEEARSQTEKQGQDQCLSAPLAPQEQAAVSALRPQVPTQNHLWDEPAGIYSAQQSTRRSVRDMRCETETPLCGPQPSDGKNQGPDLPVVQLRTGLLQRQSESPTSRDRLLAEFDRFWQRYPRKVARSHCLAIWLKRKPPIDAVISALDWQVTQPNWLKDGGQFIPHPSTWLNGGRWDDRPIELPQPEPDPTSWSDWKAAHLGKPH